MSRTVNGLVIVRTTCSGCSEEVVVDRALARVSAVRPSNGRRGSLHKPAADVAADVESDDGDLVTWTCPLCDYADSYDLNY